MAPSDSLCAFDQRMKRLSRIHAAVLGSWAGLHIVTGGIFPFITQGELFFFFIMNLSWGVVNAGIAAFLYYHTRKSALRPKTLLRRMDLQRHVEKMLLLNIGLDLAYVATGLALREHGKVVGSLHPELWQGLGASLVIQGAFLLLQDSVFYCLHRQNRKKVYPAWEILMQGL